MMRVYHELRLIINPILAPRFKTIISKTYSLQFLKQ